MARIIATVSIEAKEALRWYKNEYGWESDGEAIQDILMEISKHIPENIISNDINKEQEKIFN